MTTATLYIELLDRGLHLRIDEDDRLIVGPSSLLVDADRDAIRGHRDALVEIVTWEADAPAVSPAPRRIHPVPSMCVGKTACRHLGICGRSSCVTPDERDDFAVAMATARRPDTPHVVQRLTDEGDRSLKPIPEEEAARDAA